MAVLGILAPDLKSREDLALLAGEAGHLAHAAVGLPEAVELLRERRPRAMVVLDGAGQDAEIALREILRLAPLLPIVAVLERRDANRAVALMRAGAAEVVAPPWGADDLAACLSKAMRGEGTALSVASLSPRPPSGGLYALAVGLFLALALGHVALQQRERHLAERKSESRQWDLPYSHPAGAMFVDGELWVLDWYARTIYVHSGPDMTLARAIPLESEGIVAFAVSSDAVWTASETGAIGRRLRDRRLTPLQRRIGVWPRVLGLVHDGLYLWSLSASPPRLRRHLPDAGLTVLSETAYPGSGPAALVFDGAALWSLDQRAREIIRHNLERPEEATRRVSLAEYRGGGYRPVALAWDGERFWTVGESAPAGERPARLFRHPVYLP